MNDIRNSIDKCLRALRTAHGPRRSVNGGHGCRIERDLDQQARQQISLELGHNRIDVGLHWRSSVTKPFDMVLFLSGVLTGSKVTQQCHLHQARIIQAAIQQRWLRDSPWTWQRKHVRWFLERHLQDKAPATRYYYQLTARLILPRLGRERDWNGCLKK